MKRIFAFLFTLAAVAFLAVSARAAQFTNVVTYQQLALNGVQGAWIPVNVTISLPPQAWQLQSGILTNTLAVSNNFYISLDGGATKTLAKVVFPSQTNATYDATNIIPASLTVYVSDLIIANTNLNGAVYPTNGAVLQTQ
jgi:hypothetical protein